MSGLRSGFTTGTCAAAAAKAAVQVLLGGKSPAEVEILLPGGDRVSIPLVYARGEHDGAEAAVRKDAGDDPDVTHGSMIVARASWNGDHRIFLEAGEGVGTVTKPGLSVPPGEPAINPIPRRMIIEAIRELTGRGVRIRLSIPGGRELAARTFNPRLGIAGGLSILGTSGWVRPFSCPALRVSLKCSLDVAVASGISTPVFVPGRIGARAALRHLALAPEQIIEIGNEWGFMLESAAGVPFQGLLAVGHPGKLAKLAEGKWDTHSSRSAAPVALVSETAKAVLGRSLDMPGTMEGLFAGLGAGERELLGNALSEKIRKAISARVKDAFPISVALVNMQGDWLGSAGDLSLWK